jgi:mono/diheme cytochrome c family protein
MYHHRHSSKEIPIMLRLVVLALAAALAAGAASAPPQARQTAGWQLPPDADELKNPLTVDATVLAAGKELYAQHCQRCHGPGGLGDGPEADPENQAEMDLTNPKRAGRNPDGIVFHKVLNGRGRPQMPAFKDDLTTEQIWTVVAYAQTLRRQP